MSKPIQYTRHAKNRMRWREIAESEIALAIHNPYFVEPSAEKRLNAWKKTFEKYLRVTYREETDKILVITAVKKQKGWR